MFIRHNNGVIQIVSTENIVGGVEYVGDLPEDFIASVGLGKYIFEDNEVRQTPNWVMPDLIDGSTESFINSMGISLPSVNGVSRIVQTYNFKVNYNDKVIKLFARCVYGDKRDPKYIEININNDNTVPDGNGGLIGEYDYVLPKIGIKTYLTSKYKDINP